MTGNIFDFLWFFLINFGNTFCWTTLFEWNLLALRSVSLLVKWIYFILKSKALWFFPSFLGFHRLNFLSCNDFYRVDIGNNCTSSFKLTNWSFKLSATSWARRNRTRVTFIIHLLDVKEITMARYMIYVNETTLSSL